MLDSAPIKFAPANGAACYEDLGWRAVEIVSVFSATHRFGRLPRWIRLAARLPAPNPRKPGSRTCSGIVRLTRGP